MLHWTAGVSSISRARLASNLGCGGFSEWWSAGEGSRNVEGIKNPIIKLKVYRVNAGDVNFPSLFLKNYVPSVEVKGKAAYVTHREYWVLFRPDHARSSLACNVAL